MSYDYSHRKSAAALRVTDKAGNAIAGKRLNIELKKHEFLFGCGATEAETLAGMKPEMFKDSPEQFEIIHKETEERYQKWLRLFNYGTLHLYWGLFEPERGKPKTGETMKAAEILINDGITVKGHPLIWHTLAPNWLLDADEDVILRECLARIERDVTTFKGKIDIWDVINEVVIMPVFDKYDNIITRLCKKLGRFGIVREMFTQARRFNPDATLLINDFNTSQAYEILVEGLLDEGVSIDVIGIQSHQHQGFWGLDKLNEVLERYEHFGKPIHFTENTFVSGHIMPPEIVDLNDYQVSEWPSTPEGEERQAKDIYDMYTRLFAHPLVTGITSWDFKDGAWLGAPSGLIRKDGTPKPAYKVLDQLINDEWHTKLEVVTDENGMAEIEGFRGEYAVCGADSDMSAGSFTLDNSGSAVCVLGDRNR